MYLKKNWKEADYKRLAVSACANQMQKHKTLL